MYHIYYELSVLDNKNIKENKVHNKISMYMKGKQGGQVFDF